MKKSENKEVQNFLIELMKVGTEKHSLLIEIREIVLNIHPETNERIMFSLDSVDYSGLFVRKEHISFEFSKGFLMKDPNNFLEGKGKFRKHLKIRNKEDIRNKDVTSFVKQSL